MQYTKMMNSYLRPIPNFCDLSLMNVIFKVLLFELIQKRGSTKALPLDNVLLFLHLFHQPVLNANLFNNVQLLLAPVLIFLLVQEVVFQ